MMQAKSQAPHENVLNVRLSDLLRKKGLASSRPEKITGRKRLDISIKVGMLHAVIEAEKGQTPKAKKQAAEEADGRLADKVADIALALCYADGVNEENMAEQQFLWAVRTPRTAGRKADWAEGGLDDLVTVILSLPNELGNPDALAIKLKNALDFAVSQLGNNTKESLAADLDLPTTGKDGLNNAAMRSLLVIATAIMFHARLGDYLQQIKKPKNPRHKLPPALKNKWPPQTAAVCAKADEPIGAFSQAWQLILTVDYRPVFETACKALQRTGPGLTLAISHVADTVLRITYEAASLRHDLVGRIFHEILDSARYDGSFYTSTAGASMLASLALREKEVKWGNPESVKKLQIVDPACGTGTLLMASAERMRDLVNRAGNSNGLEKAFIENVLHGYDTNLTATHLAATTLGLLSPGTEFSNMNIERTLLGVNEKSGDAFLGSLEFMPGGKPVLLGWADGQNGAGKKSADKTGKFDFVIMNPPFTRDSLRHHQFSPREARRLRERERALFSRYFADNTLHGTSQGNNFVVLADHLTSSKGTVAAVLPMVTATNPSSRGIRRFIAGKFDIEMIVVPHDPLRQSFSENTAISELLLILRRRKRGAKCASARVIALAQNPETPAKAMVMANAIANNETKPDFVEHTIGGEQIAAGDWTAVNFLVPRLAALFNELRGGKLLKVKPLAKFGDMLSGRIARGAFDRFTQAQADGMTALWNHQTGVITKISATYDTFIAPRDGKEDMAHAAWQQRSRLMLPARLRLPLTRALSVVLSRPAIGSAWYAFTFGGKMKEAERKAREKALCLYVNSSIGALAMFGVRDFKTLCYPNFSQRSIGELPVPDFGKMGAKKIKALEAAYDKNAALQLMPLRNMALCPARKKIDHAVADALGVSRDIVDELRDLLPGEPSISGKRYQQIPLHSADTQRNN